MYIFLKNDLHFFIYIIVGKAESTHKKKLKKIRKKGEWQKKRNYTELPSDRQKKEYYKWLVVKFVWHRKYIITKKTTKKEPFFKFHLLCYFLHESLSVFIEKNSLTQTQTINHRSLCNLKWKIRRRQKKNIVSNYQIDDKYIYTVEDPAEMNLYEITVECE